MKPITESFEQTLQSMHAEKRFYQELEKTAVAQAPQVVDWLSQRYHERRTLAWSTPLNRLAHNLPAGHKDRVESVVQNALNAHEHIHAILHEKKDPATKLDEYKKWLNADTMQLWIDVVESSKKLRPQ